LLAADDQGSLEVGFKIIEIIPKHFPHDYPQTEDEFIKKQNEVSLNYRHYHQIVQKLPKYRHVFS